MDIIKCMKNNNQEGMLFFRHPPVASPSQPACNPGDRTLFRGALYFVLFSKSMGVGSCAAGAETGSRLFFLPLSLPKRRFQNWLQV